MPALRPSDAGVACSPCFGFLHSSSRWSPWGWREKWREAIVPPTRWRVGPRHRVTLWQVEAVLGPGLDLEYETEMGGGAPEPATYETAYVTSHKVGGGVTSYTLPAPPG